MNIDCFVNSFEKEVIYSIEEFASSGSKSSHDIFNDFKTIFEYKYTKSMLSLALVDLCQNIVNGVSIYQQTETCRRAIKEILVEARENNFEQFWTEFGDEITDLTQESQTQLGTSRVVANLQIYRELCFIIEMMMARNVEENLNRDGVEFIEVFFDVLNFWSGYHPLNNHETKTIEQISDSNYVNPVIIIEGLDDILDNEQNIDICNWYDHLLLKTYSGVNNRTHFPIVIASSRSHFHHREIYNITNMETGSFPSVDFN